VTDNVHVLRRINNNVVLAEENGKKIIVMGNGVGFKVYPNESIDEKKIEQTFVPQMESEVSYWEDILKEIPLDVLTTAQKVLELAKNQLDKELSQNLMVTLSDHIVFSIKRLEEGILLSHPLSWEIKQYYPKELEVAKETLRLINQELSIQLTEEEVPFLAMHFVNAQMNYTGGVGSEDVIEVIQQSVNIIKYHFQIEINQNTTSFARFVSHLRYYIIRQLKKEQSVNSLDNELIQVVQTKYAKEYNCAIKIANYLEKNYHTQTNENELVYLSLHINRLVKES
jgi:beta-glucoside operon transcriptional antiterminator